ncbi:MAG TPA: tetratricopeptide repeat protein [Vulgatibacter sp.]
MQSAVVDFRHTRTFASRGLLPLLVRQRPSRPSLPLALALALACLAGLAPRVSKAEVPHRSGLAEPSEDAWGDEWSDEESRRLAEETERRILEEAARKAGLSLTEPAATQPAPEPEAPPPVPERRTSQEASAELARALAPPAIDLAGLQERWLERHRAAAGGDRQKVAEAEGRLFEAMKALDITEVDTFAAAAARESRRLIRIDPRLALARADLSVSLSPSLPAAHLARMEALFSADPTKVGGWGGALWSALSATIAHERHLRPALFDAGLAAGLALLATGAFCLLWLALRDGRLFLHDLHHLLPKRVTRVQSWILAVLVLSLPLVLGLGPVAFAALLVAALWLYLGKSERIVIGVWLALLGFAPAGWAWLVARTAWSGTPASVYDRIERAGDFGPLAQLEADAMAKDARPEALFVLARAKKRLGAWDEARSLYERALALRPGWAPAEVNLGNVRFLEGDPDEARRHYDRAVAAEPRLAAAWFALSRIHYRSVEFAAGQTARDKAVALDRSLVSRYGPGEDAIGGNWHLADATLPHDDLVAAASRGEEDERVFAQLGGLLVPWAPPRLVALLPALFVLLLAWAATQRDRIDPSVICQRCGRPVCSRCDPESMGGQECGQCVHVYRRSGTLDPAARARKEEAVGRHRRRRLVALRLFALVHGTPIVSRKIAKGAPVLAGCLFLAALILLGQGAIRPVFGGVPAEWKAWVFGPPLAALYLVGLQIGLKAGR